MQLPFRGTSLWPKSSKPYANACTSIGSKVGYFHGRFWWNAIGQARQEFDSVEQDFLNELEAVFTDSCSSIVHFRLYLIGRTEKSAIPTIMFFCDEKGPRKRAKKAIEEGGFLKRLPGFRLGHQTRQPNIGSLIQPATGKDENQECSRSDSVIDVYFDPARPIRAAGMPIFVKDNTNVIRRATANAVFQKGRIVYMSVAHIFEEIEHQVKNQEDSESEYDFGSDAERYDDNDDEFVEATSRGSISIVDESFEERTISNASGSGSSEPIDEYDLTKRVPTMAQPPVPFQEEFKDDSATQPSPPIESLELLGCLITSSLELDCAVIQIKNTEVYLKLCKDVVATRKVRTGTSRSPPPELTAITTHTSHNSIPGLITDNATYMRLPGSLKFQKVFQITLDTPLTWGDCGTMVVDSKTAEPYGHVVASSKTKSIAYIMMASKTFPSMELQWDPILVTNEVLSSNEQKVAQSHQDNNTSTKSNDHRPLPPGAWTLNLHGNCPRCHHHHAAVKVKIPVGHGSGNHSRVQCENCHEKWMFFGGSTSTQISLLSSTTVNPDPVEREARLSLINMIQAATSMTTFASPILARIPESPPTTTNQQTSSIPARNLQHLEQASVHVTGSHVSYSTKQSTSTIKQRIQARISRLRNLDVKQLFKKSKKTKISAKAQGKLPVSDLLTNNISSSVEPELMNRLPKPRLTVERLHSSSVTSENYHLSQLNNRLMNARLELSRAEQPAHNQSEPQKAKRTQVLHPIVASGADQTDSIGPQHSESVRPVHSSSRNRGSKSPFRRLEQPWSTNETRPQRLQQIGSIFDDDFSRPPSFEHIHRLRTLPSRPPLSPRPSLSSLPARPSRPPPPGERTLTLPARGHRVVV